MRLVRALGELDAAALPAAARMNLRLDDDGAATEPPRDLSGLIRRERNFTPRHGHAVPIQDGLGLVFVNFHGSGPEERVVDAVDLGS